MPSIWRPASAVKHQLIRDGFHLANSNTERNTFLRKKSKRFKLSSNCLFHAIGSLQIDALRNGFWKPAHKKARPAEERPGKRQADREGTRYVKVAPAR